MSDNELRVRAAVIEAWASGCACTQREIAARTRSSSQRALSQHSVRRIFTRWEQTGIMETQRGKNGIPGAALRFNWMGAPATATLGDACEKALETGALPEAAQRHLRTALRTAFQLMSQCPDAEIRAACVRVPANGLHSFPARVLEAAIEAGNSRQVAMNLRSAVRRALRHAAESGVVPVIFPRAWEEDAWEMATWRYFPTDGAQGIAPSTVLVYRSNWRDYAREAKAYFTRAPYHMDPVQPEAITRDMVEELRRHLIRKLGKRYLAGQIKTVLRYVGRVHGEGPYAADFENPDTRWGYNGRTVNGYLVGPNGEGGADGDFRTLRRILWHNGFGKEWIRFFRWYHAYSTWPDSMLYAAGHRFPPRPHIRKLRARTLVKRTVAVRAWMYQAIEALRESDGLEPADITPHLAFGVHGPTIVRRLQVWWSERAAAGEVTHETSSGLTDILKGGMMIARALYDRSRHLRGLHVAMGSDGRAAKVVIEEEKTKSATEEAYWRTYMVCRDTIDSLEARRRASPDGHIYTTAKDIKRIIEQTPPSYWIALADELVRRVRKCKERGDDEGVPYHRRVLIAYVLGLMISTGFRISEVTHIRMGTDGRGHDRHYGPSRRRERRIHLRVVDRKNRRRQSAYLRERYCPAWLETEYLNRSRPFFLARGLEAGLFDAAHDWLIVDVRGRPYGCPEEDDAGEGRDEIAHASRIANLRNFWIDQLMAVAADLGLKVPIAHGEFSPHVIRNVFGYLIYQAMGRGAAADYLGDTEASVEDTYAACDGAHVDVSAGQLAFADLFKREGQHRGKDEGTAPAPAFAGSQSASVIEQIDAITKELETRGMRGSILQRLVEIEVQRRLLGST